MSSGESESSGRDYTHHLFVSYATEDVELVEPLVKRLQEGHYKVWFDRQDLKVTRDMTSNLDNALQQCRQMLICLSDHYCEKDYAQLELKLNNYMDPVNRRGRSIPVLIQPLTRPVPPEVRFIPWADLTRPKSWEAEFMRLKASILASSTPNLPLFATPAEVQALQKFDDADKMVNQARRYAREIYIFIHEMEVKGPRPRDMAGLAKSLTECDELPGDVHAHINTIETYAALRDFAEVKRRAVDPSLRALLALSTWACARYKPAMGDPFVAFWGQVTEELPINDFPFHLRGGGSRRIIPVGAVYVGQGSLDGVAVDLLVAPIGDSREAFIREAAWCASKASPLRVLAHKVIETGTGEQWGLVALARPKGLDLATIGKAIAPIPRLAAALIRQTSHAFHASHDHAGQLADSLFRAENLLVDGQGLIQVAWNWETPDPIDAPEAGSDGLQRDAFRFSGGRKSEAGVVTAWATVRGALAQALENCADASLIEGLRAADLPAGAVRAASLVNVHEVEDSKVLHLAVDAVRENRPPVWVEEDFAFVKDPPPPLKTGFALLARLPRSSCQRAWPLGPDRVLVQDEAGSLAVWRVEEPQPTPARERPFRFRRAALAPEGHVALGSWDGEVRWFHAGEALESACALGSAVGDLQWHGGRLIAGAWNGRLVRADWQGTTTLLGVADGVRRIAVSSGETFAALSMGGGVSIYRGTERKGQTPPITHVEDIAYADKRLVVLTSRGLVTVAESGAMSTPERLPARGVLRLVSDPAEKYCLLADAEGISRVVDQKGTYPRGPRLPRGNGLVTASRGFAKFTAPSSLGGFAYWRGSQVVLSWFEAVSAIVSLDGRRVVVVLPDAVEVYEEAE